MEAANNSVIQTNGLLLLGWSRYTPLASHSTNQQSNTWSQMHTNILGLIVIPCLSFPSVVQIIRSWYGSQWSFQLDHHI